MLKSIEICAGAGGQALGLEMAGFKHIALVEYEKKYCETLKKNRPESVSLQILANNSYKKCVHVLV